MEPLILFLIVVLKAAIVMGALLHLALMTIWVERKGSALIQDRIGANRAAIFGFDLAGFLNTAIADPVKALMKEDWVPKGASQFLHSMGPFLGVFPVLVSMAVIPFGPPLHAGGREITLQLADLDFGILYVFAMGSIAVYGTVLAGWVSHNKFSLFGGLRASAMMISYEVTMGLSIIGILAIYGTLDPNRIIDYQTGTIFGFIPNWGIFLNPIGFLLFYVSMKAETKRAPFDLPESESEIVAGYLTEYSGMKFLLFWLGEFSEVVVGASLVTILFFGGWHLPWYDIRQIPSDLWGFLPGKFNEWNFQWAPLVGAALFGFKVSLFCILEVIIRWTLPRFRYDQLMNLCWKGMLPLSLLNLVVTVAALLYIKGA